MGDEQFPREDELESRQATGLYPVGRVLRQTFDAENHDSLGTDLTGLMLELARIDPDAPRRSAAAVVAPLAALPSPEPVTAARPSWWRQALGRLLGR